jgi:ankyrin repeat protein
VGAEVEKERALVQEKLNTPAMALWSAAYHADRVLVERLLSEAVDVNVWDAYGRSALTHAASGGHLEIARVLIDAGAWVDPYDDYSTFMTPLMCAAESGHLEMVDLLLEKGANPIRYGGWSLRTAEGYARGTSPERRLLSAVLRRAEDEWRRTHGAAKEEHRD